MSKLQQTIETQKVINEAVEAIFKHFRREISYAESLEKMMDAQVEIMEMMELNRIVAANSEYGLDTVPTGEVNAFIYEVNEVYKLLRPFAKLMGQIHGNVD